MDPLMEESFFIENPEQLKNNFYNREIQKDFRRNFSEKSKEIVKAASMKNRHAKKLRKKNQKVSLQPPQQKSKKADEK